MEELEGKRRGMLTTGDYRGMVQPIPEEKKRGRILRGCHFSLRSSERLKLLGIMSENLRVSLEPLGTIIACDVRGVWGLQMGHHDAERDQVKTPDEQD